MYYILFGLFYLVSLLPMRVLYAIADFIFIIVYYLIGYRRKVVMRNLTEAFPEKSFAELTIIEKKFFRNMIDSMVETFKLLSGSKKFLQNRITADYQLVEHLYATGKSCQVHLGHTFNWEWGQTVLQMHTRFQVLVVYAKLSNPAFERILLKLRTRFGSIFIPGSDMKASISKFSDTQYLLGLVADQSPGSPANA
jgi:Kdo2-lipid IVA lauroyltransferase/acyltransferase